MPNNPTSQRVYTGTTRCGVLAVRVWVLCAVVTHQQLPRRSMPRLVDCNGLVGVMAHATRYVSTYCLQYVLAWTRFCRLNVAQSTNPAARCNPAVSCTCRVAYHICAASHTMRACSGIPHACRKDVTPRVCSVQFGISLCASSPPCW